MYNITRGEEPGKYVINQLSQHFVLRITPIKHIYSYTGNLTIADPVVPSKMTVQYPLSEFKLHHHAHYVYITLTISFLFITGVGGEASFTVFMTDYQTFGGIFTCQRLGFAHRQSATLLSRSKELDKIYVDKVCT